MSKQIEDAVRVESVRKHRNLIHEIRTHPGCIFHAKLLRPLIEDMLADMLAMGERLRAPVVAPSVLDEATAEKAAKEQLSNDPVERCKQIMARQSNYHLEDVLDQLKYSRPGWAQSLIHTWQNEVVQQRLITGQDDIFFVDTESDDEESEGDHPPNAVA